MLRFAKTAVRKMLERIVFYKNHDFRITALDIVRRTTALRGDWSPLTLYADWRHHQIERLDLNFYRDHPELGDIFQSYYGKIDRITLVVSFLQGTTCVAGDVAEFGVYKGHTAAAIDRVLAQTNSNKQLYLFDSFAGMPEITNDLDRAWEQADLAAPVEHVQDLFKDSSRTHIVHGFFSDTLPDYPDLRFSFCHVDADLYTSIKECIEYIIPRLAFGGIILFDDYGFRDTPGARVAVEECLGTDVPNFVPLPTAQAVYIHRPGNGVDELIRGQADTAARQHGGN
jgi:hypothetical protein